MILKKRYYYWMIKFLPGKQFYCPINYSKTYYKIESVTINSDRTELEITTKSILTSNKFIFDVNKWTYNEFIFK